MAVLASLVGLAAALVVSVASATELDDGGAPRPTSTSSRHDYRPQAPAGRWPRRIVLIEITTLAVVATAAALVHIHRLRDDDLRFAGGYLLTWAAAGLLAFVLGDAVGRLPGDVLAWDHAGRALAGGTLVVAAAYELTPLKDFCLGKCRSPLGFLLGSWRDGWSGALRMGAKNGAWCVGCCWALMASLFALGIMSVPWMAVVAVLIAVEKTLPWRRVATYGTAAVLLTLGVLLLVAPQAIPALTVPGAGGAMGPAGMPS
ncbi:MAG: Protein of unknown function transrane, metal-binding protein [Frankiales bacterium]|nr:Protein of unknown function transrane, metal-binding protein [Frankiales bacterium]